MTDAQELTVPRLGKQPLGLLDLGTNSVRLIVARRRRDGSVETLLETKETVRLGQGAYEAGALTGAAMERVVAAFARLCERARQAGAVTLFAVATAAVRDATNGPELRDRIEAATGVLVTIISGEEEARLTYLGIASGLWPPPERLVVVDLGGGSTELAAGELWVVNQVTSLPVGAIRLTEERLGGGRGPVSSEQFGTAREHVRALVPPEFADPGANVVTAGGTGLSLAAIAYRQHGERATERPVSRDQLAAICAELCALTAEERRGVPGLDPARADIIVGGGAILLGVLETLDAPGFGASPRGLRHGLALLAAGAASVKWGATKTQIHKDTE